MTWRRGTGSVELELSRAQQWIEDIDPVLRGDGSNPGLIRSYQKDKDKQEQRDEDLLKLLKLIAWIGPVAVASLAMNILRAFKVIP